MGRHDTSKTARNVPNKHIHSRISYLYQAANYLSTQQHSPSAVPRPAIDEDRSRMASGVTQQNASGQAITAGSDLHTSAAPSMTCSAGTFPPGLPFQLISHLHSISLKSQVRLARPLKHSICKRCNALLVPGCSSTSQVENLSRGRKKAWADVLVIECSVCGAQKRFPVGSQRQPGKSKRAGTSSSGRRQNNEVASKDQRSDTGTGPCAEGLNLSPAA